MQNMTVLEFFEGETKSFQFDAKNGIKIYENLENFTYIRNGQDLPFKLSYKHYIAKNESGHYLFIPDGVTRGGSIPYSFPGKASVFSGDLLIQITVAQKIHHIKY